MWSKPFRRFCPGHVSHFCCAKRHLAFQKDTSCKKRPKRGLTSTRLILQNKIHYILVLKLLVGKYFPLFPFLSLLRFRSRFPIASFPFPLSFLFHLPFLASCLFPLLFSSSVGDDRGSGRWNRAIYGRRKRGTKL